MQQSKTQNEDSGELYSASQTCPILFFMSEYIDDSTPGRAGRHTGRLRPTTGSHNRWDMCCPERSLSCAPSVRRRIGCCWLSCDPVSVSLATVPGPRR